MALRSALESTTADAEETGLKRLTGCGANGIALIHLIDDWEAMASRREKCRGEIQIWTGEGARVPELEHARGLWSEIYCTGAK